MENWSNWSEADREKWFDKFCSYKGPNRQTEPEPYVDKDNIIEISGNYTHVAKKPEQRTRSRATRCAPKAGKGKSSKVTSDLDNMFLKDSPEKGG